MGESAKGKGAAQRRIGAEAQAAFLAALRAGAGVEGAAKAGGFSDHGFYSLRWRDPAFRVGWDMARELCAMDDAQARRAAGRKRRESGELRITANNGRRLQERKKRHVKFNEERRLIFLAHFAATGDAEAAADEAGVDGSTVYKARRSDPDFAAAFDAALAEAYVRLEAEAVRQRLAAQAAMKAAVEAPAGQVAEEFDRLMKLLQRWDRRGGGVGIREVRHERMKIGSFDEAMAVLAKRLKALGYKPTLPPEQAGTEQAGTEQAGTEQAGTEQAGTVTGNCPQSPPEQA